MVDTKLLTQAIVCFEDETIEEIAKVMSDTLRRHLYVVNKDDKPIGIVSQTDIINKVVAKELIPKETKVKDIMTTPLECIEFNLELEEIYKKMLEIRTFSLPVVKNNKIIGIIDANAVMAHYEEK